MSQAAQRSRRTRSQGSLETNLCRKGIWTAGPLQLELPLEGEDLLGLVRASGRLRVTPDLDILAWLTEELREGRCEDRWIGFTLYQLGCDLYGREPQGKEMRTMRASIRRLFNLSVELVGWNARTREHGPFGGLDRLVDRVVTELEDLGPDAGAAGALRGTTFSVELSRLIADQVRAGHVTYLDWRQLRRLSGLAKRVWCYLEAESYKSTRPGRKATWIKLGPRAYTALGMNYTEDRQARAALKRAGHKIVALDEMYAAIAVTRRPGGYALVAEKYASREHARTAQAARQSLRDAA